MFKNAVIAMLSAGVVCLLEQDNPIVCKAIWVAMSFVIFSLLVAIEMQCKRMVLMYKNWIEFRRTVKEITLNRPTKAC
jgi:hypothetical protein